MENKEIQNVEIEIDPYLESSKAFHLEMPLYHTLDLAIGITAEKAYAWMTYSGTTDAYCIWCGKESVFDAEDHLYGTTYSAWRKDAGFRRNVYRCSRDNDHRYFVYYLKTKESLQKIGQWPSAADFQIPQAEKYRKILGEEEYKELTRGIGLAAHGVGIGSFVYLRRVFENLIEEAHVLAQKETGFNQEAYKKGRMDEKIELLKNHLPDFLVENKVLYSILSKGIHELTEYECLQYFETVKIGIEQILDEKIIQREKADKAAKAREAIQKAHGKINGTK